MHLRNLTVPVIRADDLLALRFEFVNLRLSGEAGKKTLERVLKNKPAYVIAHFAQQNIGEEAFFETAQGYPVQTPPGKPADIDAGNNSSQPLPPPPVQTRIAYPSRLVFKVPADAEPIDYTLEALLAKCGEYELSVAPTALPPPVRINILATAQWKAAVSRATARRFLANANQEKVLQARHESWTGRSILLRGQDLTIEAGIFDPGRIVAIKPQLAEPAKTHTAIESPYRLILSPNKHAGWAHTLAPAKSQVTGRTELWHTRLGVRSKGGVDEYAEHLRTVRAIWARSGPTANERFDPKDETNVPNHANLPFRMTLDAFDRHNVVHLSANFRLANYTPRPIQVRRLMLSSLGAWMDTRGAWDQLPSGLSVEEWRHRGTMARDNYVRVVYAGFLFPFGHRASLIKVTERKFHPAQAGNTAYLRQRMFIVVREPERIVGNSGLAYSGNDSDRSGELYDLQMPFKLVRLTTLVTPNLDPPEDSEILPGKKQSAFWPMVLKKDFQWHVVAEDLEGQVCEFAMPLVFVGKEINDFASNAASDPKQKQLSTLATNYEKSQNKERRTVALQGQLVSLAESDKAGDTTFETDSLNFGAEVPAQAVAKNLSAHNPRFFPMVRKAKLLLPALKNLVGNNQAAEFEFHHHYLVHGFANNAGKVFAKLSPDGFQTFPLSFPSDKSGGIATPNMNIQGLSRSFGPVGGTAQGVADLANGGFDPKDFFQGMSAKILGAIDLGEIITGSFLGGKNVPKLTTTPIYPGNDRTKPPTAIDTLLKWNPEVKAFGPFKPHNSNLDVEANLHTDLASGASTFTIDGELTDFDMDLFGFIILKFARVDFSAGSSKKLDVVPDIKEVVFGGPLEFVNELKDLLKFGGSGLALDVTPTGVRAGLVIAIPTISVGVLTIQNISFSAALNLPFTGEPVRFRFAFCERQDPFILTVYCFGGGGFFAIELGLDGMERLEAALEFGASAALDIGVASGSVEVMAGIYYKWEVEVALLEGYVRMGGSLNVLGIITLSLEFNLSLAYETGPNGGKVWGEASLTVEIEILFFSASVSMTVRREFADPDRVTFAKLMDSSEWADYCDAFAV